MTYAQIVSDIQIEVQKKKSGQSYQNFFIGTTESPEKQVYEVHRVSRDKDWHYLFCADSAEIADDVVCYFNMLGMRMDLARRDLHNQNCLWVYCYEITMNSDEGE